MAWVYVILAGLLEIFWVMCLKHGGSLLSWTITIAAISVSFYLLFLSYKKLPVGTVYAVFTGMGTAGIVLTETIVFGEPFSIVKLLFIGLLVTGVVGLKLVTPAEEQEVQS